MEKIFILGNKALVAEQIGCKFISVPTLKNDVEIHDWLIRIFCENEIEKLIIEIGHNEILALRLGYHVRLSLEQLRHKALMPILFLSVSELNALIVNTGAWSHILTTKGVFYSLLNKVESIKLELAVMEGIKPEEYRSVFLDRIKLLPDERVGRHSIANIWGAMSIGKSANIKMDDLNVSHTKKLYFKYVSAGVYDFKMLSINIIGSIYVGTPNVIPAKNKKILLVDDEADKGWKTVLSKVFATSSPNDFVVINEKVDGYKSLSVESKKIIENESFDLYLLDLRLNGADEEKNLKADDFSGMDVLNKIKSLNPGNQVIIFTASNKVWNLKALMDAGADGYYVKEAPEFSYSSEFSIQNYERFKQDVMQCFERGYLKNIYDNTLLLKNHILKFTEESFKNELISQLDLFWNLILKAKSETDIAYAFVTLYMLFEIVNNHFYQKTADSKWEIESTGKLLNWEWNKEDQKYSNSNVEVVGNKPPEWQKIAGLLFQKWGKTNETAFLKDVYSLIEQRNGFVHNDKRILSKSRLVFKKKGVIKLFRVVEKLIMNM